jgi:hypothetical protein
VLLPVRGLDGETRMTASQADDHMTTSRTILHGVIEKIQRDLTERLAIHESLDIVVESLSDAHIFRSRERNESRNHFAHKGREILPHRRKTHYRTLGATEGECVVDEVHQPSSFANDYVRGIAPFYVRARATQRERLTKEEDLRKRSSKLVRHACAELQSQPGKLMLTLNIPHDDDCEQSCEQEEADPHWHT